MPTRSRRAQAAAISFTPRRFDSALPAPLHRQLYDAVREAILSGQLRPQARLPSTRRLALELKVSRTTVVTAIEQLLAEGYVEGRVGSGTYVAAMLPDLLGRVEGTATGICLPTRPGRALSQRGRMLTAAGTGLVRGVGPPRPFRVGAPALDEIPWRTWREIEHRLLRRRATALRGYADPSGYFPLRQALADYLGTARAVRCTPEQVVVVSGSQQALDLVARVLLDPGDPIWVEDPGYTRATAALAGAGARLVPVPVDLQGLDVTAGIARCPDARLVYVTPSHQFPLGSTMSLSRRLALLHWASASGAWVLEDDYDSEFRYAGRPLASLQGLDERGQVLYTGTLSKVLFPGLRLGYLVVPPDLTEAFSRARELIDLGSPLLPQAVAASFIAEGYFGRHLRRMRALYASRQAALVEMAGSALGGVLDVPAAAAGMHLIGWLSPNSDDRAAANAAVQAGVETQPLSGYARDHVPAPALVLGYAAFNERQIAEAVAALAAALTGEATARVTPHRRA